LASRPPGISNTHTLGIDHLGAMDAPGGQSPEGLHA
jgi:hypothetical protein